MFARDPLVTFTMDEVCSHVSRYSNADEKKEAQKRLDDLKTGKHFSVWLISNPKMENKNNQLNNQYFLPARSFAFKTIASKTSQSTQQ